MTQYVHQRWSAESDPPLPVFSMTQSPDGYLWVGAGVSIYRFDGLRFEPIEIAGVEEPQGSVLALVTTRSGQVWAAYANSGRFAVYRNGAMRLVPGPPVDGTIVDLLETGDGAIWAGIGETGKGLTRVKDGRLQHFGAAEGLPNDEFLGMVAGRDGSLWVSYVHSVVRLPPGSARFETVRRSQDAYGRLAADPVGRIWLYDREGLRALTGQNAQGAPPPLRFAYQPADTMIRGNIDFDRDGNLWIATRTNGLRRIVRPDPSGATSAAAARDAVESFRTTEGLTANELGRIFEDQEGNVWVPTEGGLDKFRPATIRVEAGLRDRAALGDILLGTTGGDVYIGQARAIYRVRPWGRPEVILRPDMEPEAMCEGRDGSVWISFPDRMLQWRDGRTLRTLPRPRTADALFDCAEDAERGLIATAGGDGLLQWRAGSWSTPFGPPDETRFHPTLMARGADGRIALHWAPEALAWLTPSGPLQRPIDYGDGRAVLRTLYPTRDGAVLAGGTFGLSRFTTDQTRTISQDQWDDVRGVRGIVQTPEGDTWLANQTTIIRVSDAELSRAFARTDYAPHSSRFTADDGLPARVVPQSTRAMVRGGDGRLWIATLSGTVWLDPTQLLRNPQPPRVAIASVVTGETTYRDPKTLALPAGTTDLQIAYSVLSFVNPKAVRFKYRLEGHDRDWVDPGLRREAFYTNLAPGRYRFQVLAANSEGIWNEQGASVEFTIAPTFLQSGWFLLLCLLGVGVVVWALYRLRLAQASAAIRIRLEERLGERERIARELHDTFLQSVQGLLLRFQSIADRMSPDDPTRAGLESALNRADVILAEGRGSLRDLRDEGESGDVVALVEALAAQMGEDAPPVTIRTEGSARPVAPMVGAELGRIIREALGNAHRHADATLIEVSIRFRPHDLQVVICDDGEGIPTPVIALGHKPSHYGLVGMRERAERIGADLSVSNHPGGGAEVVITLSAKLAHPRPLNGGFRWPFQRFWRRRTDDV